MLVELLDIGPLLERRPGKLSGGERQRVAVGRALLMRPRLLLLDEPLASLDQARKADIMPYLERLRDEAKVPMIYVSHDAAEVKRIASRVVRLDGGTVAATGGVGITLHLNGVCWRYVPARTNRLPDRRNRGDALSPRRGAPHRRRLRLRGAAAASAQGKAARLGLHLRRRAEDFGAASPT